MGVAAIVATAGILNRDDLIEDQAVAAGKECTAVDDHIDLIRTVRDGVSSVCKLDREGCPPARKRGGYRRDVDPAVVQAFEGSQRLSGRWHHVSVNADRRWARA